MRLKWIKNVNLVLKLELLEKLKLHTKKIVLIVKKPFGAFLMPVIIVTHLRKQAY